MRQEQANVPGEDDLNLQGLTSLVDRRTFLRLLGFSVASTLTGLGFENSKSPSYTLTSRIKVVPMGSIAGQANLPGLSVEEYIVTLNGDRLKLNVAEALGYKVDEKSAQAVNMPPFTLQVARVKNTEFLDVKVTSGDKDLATTIARMFPEIAQNTINTLKKQESGSSDKPQQAVNPVSILTIEPPKMQKDDLISRLLKTSGTAGSLGFLLGAGVVLLARYFDRRIKSADEAERLLGLPILAKIYEATKAMKGDDLWSQTGENRIPFQELRQQLLHIDPPKKVISFTSSAEAEGKSTTVLGLADSLAAMGKKVIVVDGDFRKPGISGIYPPQTRGLADVINDSASLKEAQRTFENHKFSFIASGKEPSDSSRLLSSDNFKEFIEALKQKYDYVLIDGPPSIVQADTIALADVSDGMVMVVDVKNNDRKQALETVKNLRDKILGLVINNAPRDEISSFYGKKK